LFNYRPYLLLFCSVNAIIMLALAIFWLGLPRTYDDEAFFLKWTSLAKKSVFGKDEKPSPNSVLYVDVSGNKSLVETKDPIYEELTGYHYNVITNRKDLSDFINFIGDYGKDISLLVLDISFEQNSPDDSLLQQSINDFPYPILGANKLLFKGGLAPQVIDIPTATGSYLSVDNQFMKYPLYLNDSFPTLPLAMLGKIDGALFKHNTFGPIVNGNISLANPIIDFKIRPIDFRLNENLSDQNFSIFSLGTLLFEWNFWDEADIRALLKDKLIIVGDYKNDIHQTVFGNLPGPIVVHNAYLTLKDGGNLISWIWVLFFLLFFGWLTHRMVIDSERKKNVVSKGWLSSGVGKIIADSIDETIILVIATLISYFLFNIHVNILILLVYLKVINYGYSTFVLRKK